MSHYFQTLFQGEKKHGRFLFLKENQAGKLTLTFSRFINELTPTNKRLIGYEIIEDKKAIYRIML